MIMVLTLKSGTQIRIEVTEFTTRKDLAGTEFSQLSWVTPETAKTKLHSLILSEIACVHIEDD